MTPKNVIFIDELIGMIGVEETRVREWMESGLLHPIGQSEDGQAVFSMLQVERARKISRLATMGYNQAEIRRIVRKVGIPGENPKPDSIKNHQPLTVGALADRVGVSPRTIKHWEEKGIIEPDMRSEGGFRLYSESFVYLCQLVRDLQLFGYSLDEIKNVSDMFRMFMTLQASLDALPWESVNEHLSAMLREISNLDERMAMLKTGIRRWEGLLGKKSREITTLQRRNHKRKKAAKGESH
ncbi:MAG TPA: MerR family transcriptional regulator [Candidatus Aminicenantes bacterium]|nr:MerR family transcriptional regulator [Candidatus Aminicenantes bacterium]